MATINVTLERDGRTWRQPVAVSDEDTVLSVLVRLKQERDPTLTFRASCRHGICGACAIEIGGRPQLACTSRALEVARRGQLALAPLRGLPVIRDLVVDLAPFWTRHRQSQPWLIPTHEAAVVSPADVAALEGAEACISCGACYAACPVAGPDFVFAGPHAALHAHARSRDPRDRREGPVPGLALDRCHGAYSCLEVCPQDLDPASALFRVRRAPEQPPAEEAP